MLPVTSLSVRISAGVASEVGGVPGAPLTEGHCACAHGQIATRWLKYLWRGKRYSSIHLRSPKIGQWRAAN